MSRKAAAAAEAAAQIRSRLMAQHNNERLASVVSWVMSPVGAAGALSAAGLAVATLPFLKHTRDGILEGLDSDSADVIPGSDAFRETLLRGSGFVLGGASGTHVSWQVIHAATVHGAFHGYVRVPVATMGGIASAFLGMEMAEPAATLGTRVGRTMSLGAEGLKLDVQSALGYDSASPSSSHEYSPSSSSSSEGSGRGWFGSRSSRSSTSSESPRGDSASAGAAARGGGGRGLGWGGGGGSSGGGSGSSATSSATSSSRERDAASRVDATSKDALTRELLRLRRAEALATLERSRIASSHRRRELDSRLGDIRAAKADLKARCKEEHGLSLVISEDIAQRAASLTDARLALRAEADAARNNKKERRRLLREARGLDVAKRALKAEAKSVYGVKLSKHSPQMEKY